MFHEYEESEEMKKIAQRLIKKFRELGYISVDEILFLSEKRLQPNALARCYNLSNHPIGYFTDKMFCIVFYESLMHYMSEEQRILLMFHELKHIGRNGKMNEHSVQDFREILDIDTHWSDRGVKVPNLLKRK
jgi:predicted metallopeptidase